MRLIKRRPSHRLPTPHMRTSVELDTQIQNKVPCSVAHVMITYKWAKRRHPKKTRHWVVNRYYGVDRGRGWVLCDGRLQLPRHNETRVSRFVKVKGKVSPFDPNLRDYWEDRRQRRLVQEAGRFNRIHLLKQQEGRCAVCKAAFDADLDQHDSTNVVVRRDSATGDTIRALSSTAGAVQD